MSFEDVSRPAEGASHMGVDPGDKTILVIQGAVKERLLRGKVSYFAF